MSDINMEGLRFIGVLRCSTDHQKERSLPEQRQAIEHWAKDHKVIMSEWVEFADVSATYSQQLDPLLALIETKHQGNQYDGLLFDTFSRFVRTEGDSNLLCGKAFEAEILLATVQEGCLMGTGRWAVRGAATDQASGYTRDLGRNISRTVGQKIENGIMPSTLAFAFGLDRLYSDGSGTPMLNVRKHSDGRIEVRDPSPPYAHRYFFPRGVKRLSLLEKGWRFEMVPRNDEQCDLVKWMFREHYLNNRTAYSLASELNARGVPAPRGLGWRTLGIANILNNPIYLGFSVGCIRQTGINVVRNKGYPIVLPIPRRPGRRQDGKGTKKRPKIIYRDPQHWMIQEQPKLKDFLDADVRDVAMIEWERKKRDGWKKPPKKAPHSNLSRQSEYFLSRLMMTADESPMVGVGSGTAELKYRYYHSSRVLQKPSRSHKDKPIRADLIEGVVKDAMLEVLDMPQNVESLIRGYVSDRQRQVASSSLDLPKLREEKAQLEGWYREVFSVAGARGQTILVGEARKAEARLDEIDQALRGIDDSDILTRETDEIVMTVKAQLQDLKKGLDAASPVALRRLADVLVTKLVYDSADDTAHLEIGLSSDLLFEEGRIVKCAGLRTDATSDSRCCVRKNTQNGVILLKSQCVLTRRRYNTPCLTCKRLPDATLAAA